MRKLALGLAAACLLAGLTACTGTMRPAQRETTVPKEYGFSPSVDGKKLLHYRAPTAASMEANWDQIQGIGFDGFIIGGMRPFYMNEREHDLEGWAEQMRAVNWGRFTDNFYLCYAGIDALDTPDFDWFHDFDWVVDNWRRMARAARRAGFKGICFDSEHYGGRPLFGYHALKYADEKTQEEYEDQVFARGAEIMRAVSKEFPDIDIILLFGATGSLHGVPQHPKQNVKHYTMISSFVDGLLSECGPNASVHDMFEQGFALRVPGSYARARRMMKEIARRHSRVPDKFARHHKAGFSFWIDSWGDNSQGRAFDVDDFETNFYTPDELAYSIHQALAYSDKYVWMWPGALDFWTREVTTLDENGEEVRRPIPQEYLDALHQARQPSLDEPPRDRKPHFWRVDQAHTWAGWGDQETFGDLWDEYELISDMPREWRFRTDPDEVGLREGWQSALFNDMAWPKIEIREFWEPQGYSPYDGAAWYRTNIVPVDLPQDSDGLFLAFGGVADEAQVYVNGQLLYASEVGHNIRHERLLVDVTHALQPNVENLIAVRVWNVSWCGGIWKNVKLISKKAE